MTNALKLSPTIRAVDLFCGAGGSSWGAQAAGVEIVAAFDCWPLAGKNHAYNFPAAKFYLGRLETLNVKRVARDLGLLTILPK